MAQPRATSIGWNPLTQPHARPEKSLEFCEILYAIGRRSPENRSQGLRPPGGAPRHHGEAAEPGGVEAPAGAELRAAARSQGGLRWCAGRLRAQNGRDHGQGAGAQRKKPGCRGKSGRVLRETAHSGRVSGGSRGAVPGRNRENRAAAARKRRLPAGFCRENSGVAGRKRRGFGAVGGKKGRKSPHTAGFGRETGRGTAYSGRRVTGSLFFPIPRPGRDPLRAYIGRNRRRSSSDKTAAKTLCFSSGCFFRPSE